MEHSDDPASDKSSPEDDTNSSTELAAFVASVRAAIKRDVLTIDRCVSEMGVSRRTIQRRLAESGLTFQGLVDQVRLEKAATLLADENASIFEIANRLGYANTSNFARAFQRLSGVTPTQFRHDFTSPRYHHDDI